MTHKVCSNLTPVATSQIFRCISLKVNRNIYSLDQIIQTTESKPLFATILDENYQLSPERKQKICELPVKKRPPLYK